jgi:two-component system nitrate/nitrite response regulator NarL
MPGNNLRVLVVADDPLARTGLVSMLDSRPACAVVGSVAGGLELSDETALYRPDVVLWDLGWDPALAIKGDSSRQGSVPVIALLFDETYASQAWALGLHGLLLRDTDPDALLAAMQAVYEGFLVLDPVLVAGVMPSRDLPAETPIEELTPRELEVLQLLAEGLPNKAIAHELDISEHTVKFHVNAILGKLDAQSRTEAVVRATRLGLILL